MTVAATFGFSLTGPVPSAATVNLTARGVGGAPRVELTGAQTYEIDLEMMPAEGLKGMLVVLEPLDAEGSPIEAPITVTWTSNSVEKSEEISATTDRPGFIALCSPSPVNGITALSIVTTANAVVHVTALG